MGLAPSEPITRFFTATRSVTAPICKLMMARAASGPQNSTAKRNSSPGTRTRRVVPTRCKPSKRLPRVLPHKRCVTM